MEQEIGGVRRKLFKGRMQGFAGKTRVLGRFRGDRYLVNVQMRPLFSQRFTIDILRDAIEVCDLTFDLLFRALQDYPVDGFIRQFVRKAALALRKESAQAKPQTLVLLTRAVAVRTKPVKEVRKLFPGQFLFILRIRQSTGPRCSVAQKFAVSIAQL